MEEIMQGLDEMLAQERSIVEEEAEGDNEIRMYHIGHIDALIYAKYLIKKAQSNKT